MSGVKTQTRRVLKPQPEVLDLASEQQEDHELRGRHCIPVAERFAVVRRLPYAVGDRLWVREAHLRRHSYTVNDDGGPVWFLADGEPGRGDWERRKHPSIHMPRWASRLTLTVTDVRVQRLQEISEEDARAEGVPTTTAEHTFRKVFRDPAERAAERLARFADLWNSLHGPAAWDANPWVVALTFTAERRNIGAGAG